jgi:hypothetical protein
MRKKISMLTAAVVLAVSLTGCELWDEERIETIRLPETDLPVIPEPWEPEGEDDGGIG